ncbi:hypothetical protein D3C86_1933310 [compost metagenome]
MAHWSIGRRIRTTIAAIEHAVAVLVTILGIANKAAYDRTGHGATCCPSRTFDCAQATTGQTAKRAAQGPVPLVERRISRTGSRDATRKNTAGQEKGKSNPEEPDSHGESPVLLACCQ